jgi:hypothetical protein
VAIHGARRGSGWALRSAWPRRFSPCVGGTLSRSGVSDAPADRRADELKVILERLGIPLDPAAVLGIWPRAAGGIEVHLSPATFWRVVKRRGLAVPSAGRPDLLLPYDHRFMTEGVDCFTFAVAPVLPPGVLTPAYALRLT